MAKLSKFVNGYTTAQNIIKALATELTVPGVDDSWSWELVYPTSLGDVHTHVLLKTKVTRGSDTQTTYVELFKPTNTEGSVVKTNNHYLKCRFGSRCNVYEVSESVPSNPLDGQEYVSMDARYHKYNGTSLTWSSILLMDGTIVMDPETLENYQVVGGSLIPIVTAEVGSALPASADRTDGAIFVDKDDAKKYTLNAGAWGAGTVLTEGTKVLGLDSKMYTVSGSALSTGVFYTLPWGEDEVSEWADWSWFKRSTTTTIKSWLPITYWMRVTKEGMSCVLMGDPNADFEDYLISFGYFGAIKGFDGGDTDLSGNFGMTVSSDVVPNYATTYGDKTGTGCTDITMLKTRTGFPFQAHLLSLTTPDEFADRHILGPSSWTHKYHMSPAYLYHGVDGYRGELSDVIVSDRASIVHLDQLVINKGLPEEKVYQYFAINAPYSMFNNSPNVLYGVAILKTLVED
jgi:hypothetical protein